MLKSIRQKRIEDDNNKEWAQVRYSKLEHSDRSLPNFDNTQYWHDPNESSSWTTNGTRGVALPDPYYNGQKVSDEYTTPIDPLLYAIGLFKAATLELNKYIATTGLLLSASTIGLTIKNLITMTKDIIWANTKNIYEMYKEGYMSKAEFLATTFTMIKSMIGGYAFSFAGLAENILIGAVLWFIATGLLAGNTYKEIYDAWNSFEQDSINAQNKVDTEVDEDGNPLWSGYTVRYSIDYGNTTTTQSSSMKLFKHHQLKRGRYQSKAYSKSNVVYTFKYTKSITYIPA